MVFDIIYNNINYLRNTMTMQDILIELSEYNVTCQIQKGWFLIGVKFNDDWQVLEPVNKQIEFCENNGMQYYGAPLENVSLDEVFQCIRETIDYNKDLEKRLILFQEKVKELREIFKNEDYNSLKTLEFKVKKPKEKNTKKNKKCTEENNIETDKIIEKEEKVEEIKPTQTTKKAKSMEPITVDEGIVYVDTIAEMSGNKVNGNNYLK